MLPDTTDTEVILKVLPHSRERLHEGYSEALKLGLVADARLHQYLRRVNGAQRQHNLVARIDTLRFSVINNLDTSGSLTFENNPADQCVREHGKIWPVQIGKDIGPKYGLALSVTNLHVVNRAATATLHHRAILSFENRNPDRPCTFQHGKGDGVRIRRGLNKDRPTDSVVFRVRLSVPIFDAAVDIQHRLIAPCGIGHLIREKIPVILVTVRLNH